MLLRVATESAKDGDGPAQAFSDEAARVLPRGPGRVAAALGEPYAAILDAYATSLRSGPLSDATQRTYVSKVRQFLVWLADSGVGGEALCAAEARDRAVGEYRAYLEVVLRRRPATVNHALTAIDDLYIRRGMAPARVARVKSPTAVPNYLGKQAAVRFLRAVEARPSRRDRAIALIPFYAGARIGEVVALDVDDVRLSARTGVLAIRSSDESVREIPLHPQLRRALTGWLEQRPTWPGADGPALFVNRRGQRLSARSAHDIITATAQAAGLPDGTTAHVLRHTFATRLVRGGTDLLLVAKLLGHTRLESTRVYSPTTRQGAVKALKLLDVHQ